MRASFSLRGIPCKAGLVRRTMLLDTFRNKRL
jgi:hypothetical protein